MFNVGDVHNVIAFESQLEPELARAVQIPASWWSFLAWSSASSSGYRSSCLTASQVSLLDIEQCLYFWLIVNMMHGLVTRQWPLPRQPKVWGCLARAACLLKLPHCLVALVLQILARGISPRQYPGT